MAPQCSGNGNSADWETSSLFTKQKGIHKKLQVPQRKMIIFGSSMEQHEEYDANLWYQSPNQFFFDSSMICCISVTGSPCCCFWKLGRCPKDPQWCHLLKLHLPIGWSKSRASTIYPRHSEYSLHLIIIAMRIIIIIIVYHYNCIIYMSIHHCHYFFTYIPWPYQSQVQLLLTGLDRSLVEPPARSPGPME